MELPEQSGLQYRAAFVRLESEYSLTEAGVKANYTEVAQGTGVSPIY
jgi:hypothetical protein